MSAAVLLALLLQAPATAAAGYDALLQQGTEAARQGRIAEAEQALGRAIAADPRRPEAHVERGGLRFLEKRYAEAARDLQHGLERREEEPRHGDPLEIAYARDLLAAALHLSGRSDEALAQWNRLGRPRLARLRIGGLTHTRDRVVRRELSLFEGRLLDLEELQASRARLRETGAFDRITLRPVPRGDGSADLDVALVERHGFFSSWLDFGVSSSVLALQRRARLRYSNLAGSGISFGAQYRWEDARPQLLSTLDWPRPFGAPVYARLSAVRGEQDYAQQEPLRSSFHGGDLGLRHVLDGRTSAGLALRFRQRSFSRVDPQAPPGLVLALAAEVEQRWLETHRQRLGAGALIERADTALGSDLAFTRAELHLQYRASLSEPDGSNIEPSLLVARAVAGWASDATPLDEAFAPGGGPDMELPLRAHRQAQDGVLGGMPLARSLLLGNLEWRRRVLDGSLYQAGFVAFLDAGSVERALNSPDSRYWDVGLGLRVGLRGGPVLRLDWGHGLTDGRDAVFLGLGQVF